MVLSLVQVDIITVIIPISSSHYLVNPKCAKDVVNGFIRTT